MNDLDRLRQTLDVFLKKLAEVEEAITGIFQIAAIHGAEYRGPNYGEEKKALLALLDELDKKKNRAISGVD